MGELVLWSPIILNEYLLWKAFFESVTFLQFEFLRFKLMIKKWNKLSLTEKVMIAFALFLVIIFAFRWAEVWEGVQKGFAPFINNK